MKTVFLSILALFHGYFCDMCKKICQKNIEYRLKSGKRLTTMPTVVFSRFCEKSLIKWQKLEKKLIYLLSEAQTF